MRPVVKLEDGEVVGQGAEGLQEEAGAGRAVQRRRVGEAGDAAWDEVQMLRLNMEAQAQAIQGMEQARLLGEELQRARAREAELAAELKIHVDAQSKLQEIIQAKDTVIQSLNAKFAKAQFVAAVAFNKLDANTAIELRKAMRGANVDYKVVKNTLAIKAAKGTAVEALEATGDTSVLPKLLPLLDDPHHRVRATPQSPLTRSSFIPMCAAC